MKSEKAGRASGAARHCGKRRGGPLVSAGKASVAMLLFVSSALTPGRVRAQVPCPPELASPSATPAAQAGPFQFFGGPGGPGRICYPAGWNLVGGPATFPVPLQVWDPSAQEYQELPADSQFPSGPPGESDGQGAWAYFPELTAVTVGGFPLSASVTVSLAAGQWQQIGDPFPAFQAAVCQAGTPTPAFAYDPARRDYSLTATLKEGQGAWIYSREGGDVLLIPAGVTSGCPQSAPPN